MLVSFVSFLGTMFAFIWLGCTPSGTVKRRGWAWLAAAALSLSLWLLSLPRIPPPYSLEILKHYVTPPVE